VRVVPRRRWLTPRGVEDVGVDRVHPGREGFRLAALQLRPDLRDAGIAERRLEPVLRPDPRDPDHRRVEVVARRLQVTGARMRVIRDFGRAVDDRAVPHRVEHGHEGRHRMGKRPRVGVVKAEGLHPRQGGEVRRGLRPRQPFERERPEVDRPVAVGEELHR
jgi:hypothetical protein